LGHDGDQKYDEEACTACEQVLEQSRKIVAARSTSVFGSNGTVFPHGLLAVIDVWATHFWGHLSFLPTKRLLF
jgi:hypothetical protein